MPKIKATTLDKAMFWICNCGHTNHAPALQAPDNTIICEKCEKEFRWRQIRADQKR